MKKGEHGGNLYKLKKESGGKEFIDFSANINPLAPPDWLRSVISREVENLIHYPDPASTDLINALSDHHQIAPDKLIAGNGTSELLYFLLQVIDCRDIVLPVPSYIDYKHAATVAKKQIKKIYLKRDDNFTLDFNELNKLLQDGDCLVLGLPNNPTGVLPNTADLRNFINKREDIFFIIDEAFLGFCQTEKSFAGFAENVVTLNSMTKLFGVPGIRLGYCSANKEIIDRLKECIPAWNVNHLAQKIGVKAIGSKDFKKKSVEKVRELRIEFYNKLKEYQQIEVYPSSVNYHLCRLKNGKKADWLKTELANKGIIIRVCDNYDGLDEHYFRLAVRSKSENELLLKCLDQIFSLPKRQKVKKTSSLMIQGTCSNAGKSIITAALCRIFLQDGVDVCPFKAQNMSLNSFVTTDGGEMGRAQVVQAQAAKLNPDWKMNPILLKPNSETGSQVIVHGKPVGNMDVRSYHAYKTDAWDKIVTAYDDLSAQHDLMLLEGAGSPGEVNLKKNDIVNMKMAQYAHSPVLLVGDIDRGGVYASFVGIMEVLEEWERKLIAGFIVNKFRGDATLLEPAHEFLEHHSGKKVLGVVPHLNNLGLPEEDSVSFKIGSFNRQAPDEEHIVIGAVNLPHISNFTDFEPFLEEPDVHLKIINNKDQLESCDAIILPGSKNVISDLHYLIETGIADSIRNFAGSTGKIAGICGGFQMLGMKIIDPFGIESDHAGMRALQLLDIHTTLEKEKCLTRKSGTHKPSGMPVEGYEIHHGKTTVSEENAFIVFDDNSFCGQANRKGNIWGCYLHGIFDSDSFRRWFIDDLRLNNGLKPLKKIQHSYSLEKEFEKLASTVRESIDMDHVYSLVDV